MGPEAARDDRQLSAKRPDRIDHFLTGPFQHSGLRGNRQSFIRVFMAIIGEADFLIACFGVDC